MKKILSISFAILILLSGMHLSFATHICCGEVAGTKWSFVGERAGCGMEESEETSPVGKTMTTECCHNKIAMFTVDNIYSPSFHFYKEVQTKSISEQYVPEYLAFKSPVSTNSFYRIISPHNQLSTSAVSLAKVCVFRN